MRIKKEDLFGFIAIGVVWAFIVFITESKTTCFFKVIYGVPCPGCGLVRSFIHLFRGDLKGAFFYHPLFPLAFLVGAVTFFRRKKPIHLIYKSELFWIVILIIIIGVWGVRMFLMFPDTGPMDYSRQSILYRLYDLIK
ncbi:MAG: DUF2752 domain-containing protein [Spirochaetes bacterium]|nr:DUF2752 domain-containing protein [Spirochaetota bacterium]